MRVLIYGAGAVGQAVGGLLAEGPCEVTMLLRPEAAEAIARDGLRIEGIFGRRHIPAKRLRLMTELGGAGEPESLPPRTTPGRGGRRDGRVQRGTPTSPITPGRGTGRLASGLETGRLASGLGTGRLASGLETGRPAPPANLDFVLVTVKSCDTAAAADAIRRIDDGKFVVVSMQNGYGNVERLTATFGADRVLCARVITGFLVRQPGTVEITVHADSITIGRFDGAESPAAERLAAALTAVGLPARASRQVQAELWAKILYNCALNPLGAILGANYGQLAERPETRALMDRIIEEAYAVLAAGRLPRLFATADDFRDAFYKRMVPPTAGHTPSMLQDLRAGKRTEIDALNGAIAALGQSAGIDTPINSAVAAMVRFLEARAARPRRVPAEGQTPTA